MIYQLTGKVIQTSENMAVVDVNGVGYGVHVPARLLGARLIQGVETTLFTITIVRQDEISLYGFLSNMDRQFFRMLLNIPRIGPKGALKILSTVSSVKIMQGILAGDRKALSRYPGIGPKAARRLILELQEKVKSILADSEVEYEDSVEEAVEVLMGLGCDSEEARDVLMRAREEAGDREFSLDDLLNEALRIMAGKESG